MSLSATHAAAAPPEVGGPSRGTEPLRLVTRLSDALRDADVSYVQWKGHGKRHRWATGQGDIDLLVDRSALARFTGVLGALGFKLTRPRNGASEPGVFHYYGLDEPTGRLVHVHAYARMVVGEPWRRHYRLPLERAVLASAVERPVFPTPAPEFELVLLVLRLTLRYSVRDLRRAGPPPWLQAAREELERLEESARLETLPTLLSRHLPEVDARLFDACRRSLRPGTLLLRRLWTRFSLERRLAAHRVRPPVLDTARAIVRALLRRSSAHPLAGGGAVVALLGGDGAGKSTCARALDGWLAPELAALHLHLGRPPRSVTTLAVGAAWKAARRFGPTPIAEHLELLRYVCTARDRLRLYARARRFAAAGGIALCERYPLPANYALAGPSDAQGEARVRSRLATALRRWEHRLYALITRPDVLFVFDLDPETAVRRKPEEPADYVRARGTLVRGTDWAATGAILVDAARPVGQVLLTVKAELWNAV